MLKSSFERQASHLWWILVSLSLSLHLQQESCVVATRHLSQPSFSSFSFLFEHVTGYHNTKPDAMSHITTKGLMTRSERGTHAAGLAFGDGIYTANNPFAFQHFGPVGLLVARLQGIRQRQQMSIVTHSRGHVPPPVVPGVGAVDTVVGNKADRKLSLSDSDNHFQDEIVL
jgi:hypothetical protein